MITYLKGIVTETEENSITLETYNIGYEVFCSSRTIGEVSTQIEEVKLYIYEHKKEDSHDLYGFYHKEERDIFKKLISVSGIGAKSGLQILNLYDTNELIEIIISGDIKALNKVSGIGPKTAQRIILELKDSLSKFKPVVSATKSISHQKLEAKNEAIEALEALGYSSQEAIKAVDAINDYYSNSETLIRKALHLLAT